MSSIPKSGSCTFSKLLFSVQPSSCLNVFSAFLPLDLFLCWPFLVPNAYVIILTGIFSEFKFFFKALYYEVALQGKLPLICFIYPKAHPHPGSSSCVSHPLYLMSLLSSSHFSPSCSIVLILCVHMIYAVSSAKAIWPNSHANYGYLLHKDGVRGVILVLLLHQDLNLIYFFQ